MASERRLAELYNKWFLRRLPTGETLNLPISPQLEEIFRDAGAAGLKHAHSGGTGRPAREITSPHRRPSMTVCGTSLEVCGAARSRAVV